MNIKTAIILAGGLGTRLRGVVSDRPKPMAIVSGRPFLEYLMDYWISQGIQHFILSVGYMRESISDHFGCMYKNVSLEYSIEEQPLGTGGALIKAAKFLKPGEAFILLNGDTFFPVSLKELVDFSSHRMAGVCFSLFPSTDHVRYLSVLLGDDGNIVYFSNKNQEYIQGEVGKWVNGGVYYFEYASLSGFIGESEKECSLENEVFPLMLKNGVPFYGKKFSEVFIDIGVPSDYYKANGILNQEGV